MIEAKKNKYKTMRLFNKFLKSIFLLIHWIADFAYMVRYIIADILAGKPPTVMDCPEKFRQEKHHIAMHRLLKYNPQEHRRYKCPISL